MSNGSDILFFAVHADECEPNPCKNGAIYTNDSSHGGYKCTCQAGYTGSNCKTGILVLFKIQMSYVLTCVPWLCV